MNGIARCRSCDTKIGYFYFSFGRYHNVLRLNIPVYNIFIMCRFDPASYLNRNTDRFFIRQLTLFFDICFKRNAFHVLHHDKVKAIFASYVINIHDIGMLQPCR